MGATASVVLVSADPRLRRSLERLTASLLAVAVVADPQEALRRLTDAGADILLVDGRRPESGAITLLAEARRRSPGTLGVLMGGEDAGTLIAAINQAHVFAYLPAPIDDRALGEAIQRARDEIRRRSAESDHAGALARLGEITLATRGIARQINSDLLSLAGSLDLLHEEPDSILTPRGRDLLATAQGGLSRAARTLRRLHEGITEESPDLAFAGEWPAPGGDGAAAATGFRGGGALPWPAGPDTGPDAAPGDLRFILRLDGSFDAVDPGFEPVLGIPLAEILAGPFLNRIHPGDRADTLAQIGRLAAGLPVIARECRLRRGDGSYRTFLWAATPREGVAYGVARDVTDRKRAEGRMARLAAIVDYSEDAVISATLDGVITSWNRGAERLYGFRATEMIGRPIGRILPPGCDRERADLIARILGGEQIRHFETVRRHKDGRDIPVSLSFSPVRDRAGRIVEVAAVARDITDQRRAAIARAHLAAIVESSEDAIVSSTLEGIITSWNRAAERLFGWPAGEAIGRPVSATFVPEDQMRDRQEFVNWVAGGEAIPPFDTVGRHRDGTPVDVSISISAIRDDAGGVIGISTILRDIGERKAAERQHELLARAEKLRALGQMAGGIAHDLNQSLALVSGFGELAQHELAGPDPDLTKLRSMLATMSQAAHDGGETVKRLLTFARGHVAEMTEAVDLGVLLEEVARLTAPSWRDAAQAQGHPIRLLVETEGAPRIAGSTSGLREALTNLIINAVDALPLGGTIRLRATDRDHRAVIEVTDTGTGIPLEHLERIFEPFYTSKGERGTGLGLAQVSSIVAGHGGEITVRSAVGEGTIFSLTFPLVEEEVGRPADRAEADHPPVKRGSLRILAVDDERTVGEMIARVLQIEGHAVDLAASAGEAIEKLATGGYDLLISDVGLGTGPNGWDLSRDAHARWPDLPIILATGWGAAIDPDEARREGVGAVLAKPYRLRELRAAVDQVVRPGP